MFIHYNLNAFQRRMQINTKKCFFIRFENSHLPITTYSLMKLLNEQTTFDIQVLHSIKKYLSKPILIMFTQWLVKEFTSFEDFHPASAIRPHLELYTYFSYVDPILMYASTVCRASDMGSIKNFESVNRLYLCYDAFKISRGLLLRSQS